MKRVNSQSIGAVLDNFFEQYPELADKMAEARLLNSWKTTLGASISRFTDNMFIKKRTLYVRITSSILKNELMMCREQLVKKLNEQAGREVIDSIVLI
jgi:predicted nucleic acid-binding Zn ribbon protein